MHQKEGQELVLVTILRESHHIQRNNQGNKRARYVDYRLGKIFRDAQKFKEI